MCVPLYGQYTRCTLATCETICHPSEARLMGKRHMLLTERKKERRKTKPIWEGDTAHGICLKSFNVIFCFVSDLRTAFDLLDRNQDGRVEANELQFMLKNLGIFVRDELIDDLIKEASHGGIYPACQGNWQFISLLENCISHSLFAKAMV